MKLTVQRPTVGTVPRKLELVNVSCVERHIPFGKWIVVSPDRVAISISFLPAGTALSGGKATADAGESLPPFWELEALIEEGFQRDLALDVIAARHKQPGRHLDATAAPATARVLAPSV